MTRVTAEQLRIDGEALLSETGIDGDTHPNWAIGENILSAAAEIDRLLAEVELLREALRKIKRCSIAGYNLNGKESFEELAKLVRDFHGEMSKRVTIARAALEDGT